MEATIELVTKTPKKYNNWSLVRRVFPKGRRNLMRWKWMDSGSEVTKRLEQEKVVFNLRCPEEKVNQFRALVMEETKEERPKLIREVGHKLKLAVDVFYRDGNAHAVGVVFRNIYDEVPTEIFTSDSEIVSDYIPGQFYKRELPPLQKLITERIGLEKLKVDYDMIIVDGLYDLWDGKPGLGHHLKDWLDTDSLEIVGVAKSKIREAEKFTTQVIRGENTSHPLYVNGSRKDRDFQGLLEDMAGEYRIPYLLKLLDTKTRKI